MNLAAQWLSFLCLLNMFITLPAASVNKASAYLTLTSCATWQDSESTPPKSSSLAVDTNLKTCSQTGNSTGAKHWFVVDLGSIIDVMKVAITSDKTTCSGNFIKSYEILMANLTTFNPAKPETNMKSCGTFSQTLKCPTVFQATIKGLKKCYGRYLMLSVTNSSGPLTVCNLKVKRTITSLNLVGNPSWQDSVSAKTPYPSSLAIDGKISQNSTLGQCAQTDIKADKHWWVVDLKSVYQIYSVIIYAAKNNSSFVLNNFDLKASSVTSFSTSQPDQGMNLCHHYSSNATVVPSIISIYPQVLCSGRFLMIALQGLSLTICEVQVKVF